MSDVGEGTEEKDGDGEDDSEQEAADVMTTRDEEEEERDTRRSRQPLQRTLSKSSKEGSSRGRHASPSVSARSIMSAGHADTSRHMMRKGVTCQLQVSSARGPLLVFLFYSRGTSSRGSLYWCAPGDRRKRHSRRLRLSRVLYMAVKTSQRNPHDHRLQITYLTSVG
jgi:hypothetical protein